MGIGAERMKRFLPLFYLASAEEVPGLNGWHVTCRVPIPKPGFTLIDDNTLYQASYGVGSTDSIYRIRDFNGTPQGCIQNFDRLEQIIDKGIPWPNEIARVPDRIMHDGKKWYTVAAGFNTPGKNDGCVAMFDGSSPNPSETLFYLTPGCNRVQGPHDPYFYHRVRWADMDGDGDNDLVTARAMSNGVDVIDDQLVWLENDGRKPGPTHRWQVNIITELYAPNSADMFFDVVSFPRAGGTGAQNLIITGSFYQQKLELIWTENPLDNWKFTKEQKSAVIARDGFYTDIRARDINGNNKIEIFASTASRQGQFGTTVAYEQNGGDWREPTSWLSRSFYNRFPMFANPVLASPGGFAFGKLRVGDEHKKEHVFVAGYSDGQVYMHSPSSDLASSWRYDTQSIYQSDDELGGITLSGHTIRMVAMGEFNSDDKTDLVIPNNERNQVLILEQND